VTNPPLEYRVLDVVNLNVCYGPLHVLWDVSLTVAEGEIVALLGSNGAGKTTTLKTIQGLLRPSSGQVCFVGESVHNLELHRVVASGLCLVPEDRLLFPEMTVLDNLELGAFPTAARQERRVTLDWVYQLFPAVSRRAKQKVKTLSGGEQQMVAIGRALMAKPKLLLLDEPSLGLAPLVVTELFRTVKQINRQGISVLLVEQDVKKSLELAHRAYVLETGKIIQEGSGVHLLNDPRVREAYLGV
jgi:branched-chain amino acid transport system ATP-binding protein